MRLTFLGAAQAKMPAHVYPAPRFFVERCMFQGGQGAERKTGALQFQSGNTRFHPACRGIDHSGLLQHLCRTRESGRRGPRLAYHTAPAGGSPHRKARFEPFARPPAGYLNMLNPW